MDWSIINLPIPVATFILGWLVSRYTLTKTDKKKLEQEYFRNSQELRQNHDTLYREYAEAIRAYTECDGEPTFAQFYEIAVKGDRYFGHMNVVADAILSDKVDRQIRDSTFVPGICKAASVSLPRHYDVLQAIAKKKGFSYSGELDRTNFGSLYAVAEKYGHECERLHTGVATGESAA